MGSEHFGCWPSTELDPWERLLTVSASLATRGLDNVWVDYRLSSRMVPPPMWTVYRGTNISNHRKQRSWPRQRRKKKASVCYGVQCPWAPKLTTCRVTPVLKSQSTHGTKHRLAFCVQNGFAHKTKYAHYMPRDSCSSNYFPTQQIVDSNWRVHHSLRWIFFCSGGCPPTMFLRPYSHMGICFQTERVSTHHRFVLPETPTFRFLCFPGKRLHWHDYKERTRKCKGGGRGYKNRGCYQIEGVSRWEKK